ncbi:MAG TPA: cupin domain-containing protein [Gaiellaceae bacterium]
MRPLANLYDVELQPDEDDAPGYAVSFARIGQLVGGEQIGMSVYELSPGQSICPYHYEATDEEWLICLAGAPRLRVPDGEQVLEPGDVVCFPAGEAGAHKVTAGEETARVAIFSTKSAVGVAVYPDSKKLGVWYQDRHHMVRLEPQLDYFDGEAEARNSAT